MLEEEVFIYFNLLYNCIISFVLYISFIWIHLKRKSKASMCQSIKSNPTDPHRSLQNTQTYTFRDKLGLLVTTSHWFIVPYFPAKLNLWPSLNRSTSPHSKRPGFPVNQAMCDPNSFTPTPTQLWAFVKYLIILGWKKRKFIEFYGVKKWLKTLTLQDLCICALNGMVHTVFWVCFSGCKIHYQIHNVATTNYAKTITKVI